MKKALIYFGSLFSLISSTVLAKPATSGFVIGTNAGFAALNTFETQPANSHPFEVTTGQFSWGIYGGYNYAVNPNVLLGGQAGYNDFGQSKYQLNNNSFKIEATAWDILATATYLWDNHINVFTKLGGTYITQHMSGSFNGVSAGDQSNFEPEIAIGAGYLYKRINFNLEYRHIFANGQTSFGDTFNNNNNLTPTGFNGVAAVNAIYFGLSYQLPF